MVKERYTFSECYWVLRVDPKTFRRWLEQAEIAPTISKSDSRVKYLTDAQVQELATLHERTLRPLERTQEAHSPEAYRRLADRVSALEQEVAETRSAMDTLQQQIQRYLRSQQASSSSSGPVDQTPAEDLVRLSTFADQHLISRNEADRRWRAGFITVAKQPGPGKRQPQIFLDAKGRRDFWVQFHNTAGFRSCDDCPHLSEQ